MNIANNPIVHGTTIFVGSMPVQLTHGEFMSYTYQNLINKSYIIALVSGEVNADKPVYCRVHSSCVTSETLGSLDCDCCSQMDSALKIISAEGGIFFYLLQEGRGCGYVGKSRACMHVQSSEDKMDTFEAYKKLGMKKDYRKYDNLKDILHMLNLDPTFILLSNNPDKVAGFREAGLQIDSVRQIEIQPNPFNIHYLRSKKKSGHQLQQTQEKQSLTGLPSIIPQPFDPYNLDGVRRFIHVSRYYLPIAPICGKMKLRDGYTINKGQEGVVCNNLTMIKTNQLTEFDSLEAFWFRVSVYYDLINQNEFVVLEYKNNNLEGKYKRNCCIRIHSESIFNRFPLSEPNNRVIYQRSLEKIIVNGYGKLILFYKDGRGFGLGNFVLNKSALDNTGVETITNNRDGRDYYAVSLLLKHILPPEDNIDLCFSCARSMELAKSALEKNSLVPKKLFYVGTGRESLGHKCLQERYHRCLGSIVKDSVIDTISENINIEDNCIVTGIGSSISHAKYLLYLLDKDPIYVYSARFVPISQLLRSDKETMGQIILFSQGLSQHARGIIEKFGAKNTILVTALKKTSDILPPDLQHHIKINCSEERETLLRLEGPFIGFMACHNLMSLINPKSRCLRDEDKNQLEKLSILGSSIIDTPTELFTQNLLDTKSICIICSHPNYEFIDNIKMKFVEGCGISNCILCDPYEFAHGTYQSLIHQRDGGKVYPIIYIDTGDNGNQFDCVSDALTGFNVWRVTSNLSPMVKILEYEIIINNYLLQLLERCNFNQKEWPGKSNQCQIYNYINN